MPEQGEFASVDIGSFKKALPTRLCRSKINNWRIK